MSDDPSTLGGTPIQTLASNKSFRASEHSDASDAANLTGQQPTSVPDILVTDPDTWI